MFSEIAEIALVAARLGQFLQFLKTRVILILNFTRPHAITRQTDAETMRSANQERLLILPRVRPINIELLCPPLKENLEKMPSV